MQRFHAPSPEGEIADPLVQVEAAVVPGSQLEAVVQQWRTYATPEGSDAVTVALALVAQPLDVGENAMVGGVVSQAEVVNDPDVPVPE